METAHFLQLTELAGSEIAEEQLARMVTRYVWASGYCGGKDVLEVACGAGPGLRLLSRVGRSVTAGDYSREVLKRTDAAHGRVARLQRFDAQFLPFAAGSFDVLLLFEALYYVPAPDRFFAEAKRVLRPGGVLLIATANKDLYDFNPSPYTHGYLNGVQLAERLGAIGFRVELFGDTPADAVPLRQRVLRPAKAAAAMLGLLPKTADGKLWLKRLMFGRMRPMPESVDEMTCRYIPPTPISAAGPDRLHKVILCKASVS